MRKKRLLSTALIVMLLAIGIFPGFNTAQAGVAEATAIFLQIAPGARAGGWDG